MCSPTFSSTGILSCPNQGETKLFPLAKKKERKSGGGGGGGQRQRQRDRTRQGQRDRQRGHTFVTVYTIVKPCQESPPTSNTFTCPPSAGGLVRFVGPSLLRPSLWFVCWTFAAEMTIGLLRFVRSPDAELTTGQVCLLDLCLWNDYWPGSFARPLLTSPRWHCRKTEIIGNGGRRGTWSPPERICTKMMTMMTTTMMTTTTTTKTTMMMMTTTAVMTMVMVLVGDEG